MDLKDRLKKHEGMATINPNKVYVGDRAEVGGRKGTVMYVGPADFAAGGVVVGLRRGRFLVHPLGPLHSQPAAIGGKSLHTHLFYFQSLSSSPPPPPPPPMSDHVCTPRVYTYTAHLN